MDPENKEVEKVDDEAALDAELDKSINDVRAGKPLEEAPPAKTEGQPVEKKDENPPAPGEGPTGEDNSNPPAPDPLKDEKGEFRIPNKGKFESDEAYEKRIELFDLVKRRKAAVTPEAKEKLSEEIKKTKGDLKILNNPSNITNPLNKVDEKKPGEEEDPALKADKERLKALGGATKEDVQEMVRQERLVQDMKSILDKFVARHPEFKDEDAREVFFDFVDENYNWSNKSGAALMTILELAHENMFKPSETVEERVLKGAGVAEKVKTMSFPGGGAGQRQDLSPEMRKSVDELKATGMSEEKALELLAE